MLSPTSARWIIATLLAGAGIALFTPAHAQLGLPVPGAGPKPSVPEPEAPSPPPAPAIPGSHVQPDTPAPAQRLPLDMPPTEALFDAINRGDIAGVRDALSRGADLNGKNLLGLTPLELAVDLGRNEISFLLLTMRGTGSAEQPRELAGARTAAAANAPDRRRVRTTAQKLATVPPTAAASAAAVPSFGGGTPVPSAGFLGFDLGRGTSPAPADWSGTR